MQFSLFPQITQKSKNTEVSSMKSTTKLSRILIHHRRSTVILCRWIRIDRRYLPYSPVGESLSTVDIDRDWSTRSINWWIGVDIQIDVGTIFHNSWDHDSFVDVYPGPSLITSGTIWDHKSWSFFSWLLGKSGRAQRPSVWIVTRESASEQWAPKRPGDAHLAVSIRIHWRRLRRGWSPVQAESAPLFKYICMYRYVYIHT